MVWKGVVRIFISMKPCDSSGFGSMETAQPRHPTVAP